MLAASFLLSWLVVPSVPWDEQCLCTRLWDGNTDRLPHYSGTRFVFMDVSMLDSPWDTCILLRVVIFLDKGIMRVFCNTRLTSHIMKWWKTWHLNFTSIIASWTSPTSFLLVCASFTFRTYQSILINWSLPKHNVSFIRAYISNPPRSVFPLWTVSRADSRYTLVVLVRWTTEY